jgi:hypothetical protein
MGCIYTNMHAVLAYLHHPARCVCVGGGGTGAIMGKKQTTGNSFHMLGNQNGVAGLSKAHIRLICKCLNVDAVTSSQLPIDHCRKMSAHTSVERGQVEEVDASSYTAARGASCCQSVTASCHPINDNPHALCRMCVSCTPSSRGRWPLVERRRTCSFPCR